MNNEVFSIEFIKRWESFYGRDQTRRIQEELRKEDPKVLTPNTLITDKTELRKPYFRT